MPQNPVQDRPSTKACPQCGTSVIFKQDASTGKQSCPNCGYVLPQQIGHFKILNIIGSGGMGAVYQGLDISLERNVAIKIIREEFARNPQAVESFLREARAAAALNHPNIAQIYSFGEHMNRYYLVMEFLPHGSMDDRIEHDRRMPELEVLDVGIQIASGLQAAHERGLIHRDIKPGNILFTQDGTAKVVDFGLARLEKKSSGLQEEGIWGTPYYIAPEKVGEGREDFRSDIYSLGGTLFHALAGRAPFEAGTSIEVVEKHLHSPGVSLRTFAPHVTPQTVDVIGRMLKKDPNERPQSYDELLNDLAYAKRFALQNRPQEAVEAESEFSTGMIIGTLFLIIVSLGVGFYLYQNRERYFGITERQPEPPSVISPTTLPPPVAPTNVAPIVKKPPTSTSEELKSMTAIDEAMDAVGKGSNKELNDALGKLERIKISNKLQAYDWSNLYAAALKQLLDKKDDGANGSLAKVVRDIKPDYFSKNNPEGKYPQLLALILTGKIPEDYVKPLAEKLPQNVVALAYFFEGISQLRHQAGDRDSFYVQTLGSWNAYLNCDIAVGPKAPYAFRGLVEEFKKDFEAYKELRTRILTDDAHIQASRETLNSYPDNWHTDIFRSKVAFLKKYVDTRADEIQKKQDELKRQRDEQAKAEYARKLDSEMKLIETVRTKRKELIESYQFDDILANFKALENQVTTAEAKKLLSYHEKVSSYLLEFLTKIQQDVPTAPYDKKVVTRSGMTMVGKLSEIKNDKLFFRVEFGEISCRWSDLTPLVILQISDYYLNRAMNMPQPDNADIGRRALVIAVFTREVGLDAKTAPYLEIANKSGAVAEDLQELFPKK